jgi:1,4-alpha-glucan branching enzyme
MGIIKQYLKTKPICKATFYLSAEAVGTANKVNIVGDFNEWDIEATPMKKQKNGSFTVTLSLEPGKYYHFRYLIDGEVWENDWSADAYVPTPYGDGDNSVVML